MTDTETDRRRDGTFKKGNTGNPKGRPRKQITRMAIMRQALVTQDYTELQYWESIVAEMKSDPCGQAAKMWVDFFYPKEAAVKPLVRFDYEPDDLDQSLRNVIAAVATGQLPPDTGQLIAAMITNVEHGIELADMLDRIEALKNEH